MRMWVSWSVLILVLVLATAALGWWTVPLAAAVWGVIYASERRVWLSAAAAAAVAWALLLVVTALGGRVLALADKLGGAFGLPGIVIILLTLLLPAALAGSASGLAATVWTAVRGSLGAESVEG
jgi:hypothetical protein